ncbi:MAG: hypothetical protein R3F65_08175 [bacterium]
MRWLSGAAALLWVSVGVAWGQVDDRFCLPGEYAGDGLQLAVDGRGRVHLARVDRIGGRCCIRWWRRMAR